jgi:hypothetical protein
VRYNLRNGNWRSVPLDREVFNKSFSASDRDACIFGEENPTLTFERTGEDGEHEILLFEHSTI